MNELKLTIYLIDGTYDYIKQNGDVADLFMNLNRSGWITTNDVSYPLHAIVKIKFDWGGRLSDEEYESAVREPDWPYVKKLMDDYKAKRRRRKSRKSHTAMPSESSEGTT
jgi:hypothetical protein